MIVGFLVPTPINCQYPCIDVFNYKLYFVRGFTFSSLGLLKFYVNYEQYDPIGYGTIFTPTPTHTTTLKGSPPEPLTTAPTPSTSTTASQHHRLTGFPLEFIYAIATNEATIIVIVTRVIILKRRRIVNSICLRSRVYINKFLLEPSNTGLIEIILG